MRERGFYAEFLLFMFEIDGGFGLLALLIFFCLCEREFDVGF
jgi:hypothetical protein